MLPDPRGLSRDRVSAGAQELRLPPADPFAVARLVTIQAVIGERSPEDERRFRVALKALDPVRLRTVLAWLLAMPLPDAVRYVRNRLLQLPQ